MTSSRLARAVLLEVSLVLAALTAALASRQTRPLVLAGPFLVWWLLRRDPGGLQAAGFERRRLTWPAVFAGGLAGVSLFAVAGLAVWPAAEWLTGSRLDTAELREAVSTRAGLLTMLVVSWVLAGFGEEWMFRAYPVARTRHLTRPVQSAVAALAVFTFALGHVYQGPAGVLLSGVLGALLLVLYLLSGRNLWVNVIAHGTVDTCAFLSFHLGGLW